MIKPNFKTTAKKKTKDYGEFILTPLEPGYGHTLGNALRRVLLTSLPGAAITQIKIKGVRHPFTTLKGLKEDVVEFCLNIKQVRIRVKRGEGPFSISLDVKGPGEFTAGQIKTSAGIQIVNDDLVLGNLADKKTRLEAKMEVKKGFGFQLGERMETKIGLILLDAVFTPVIRVAYEIKPTRVGQRTDLDQLILKIWTDGTIEPEKALQLSAKILVSHFQQIYEPIFETPQEEKKEEVSLEVLKLSIEEVIPTRIANALMKGGFKTLGDLSRVKKEEILKVKNFGEKSFKILERKLKKKGVSLAA